MPIPVISRSKFVQHERYPEVLHLYNENFKKTEGKLSDNQFYDQVIAQIMPGISKISWYSFLRKVKTQTGMVVAATEITPETPMPSEVGKSESELESLLLSNDTATQRGIQTALNLGAALYSDIWRKYKEQGYAALDSFERKIMTDSLHKAMKSQDSRIHAIGKVKESNLQQKKFERAFSKAAYD